MRFPSKVTPYSASVVAAFPRILDAVTRVGVAPSELYASLRGSFADVGEFAEALDCLYALGEIELDSEGRVLRIVD